MDGRCVSHSTSGIEGYWLWVTLMELGMFCNSQILCTDEHISCSMGHCWGLLGKSRIEESIAPSSKDLHYGNSQHGLLFQLHSSKPFINYYIINNP